ncbi:MAG: hypothetical protein WA922_08400 [Pontixanthobacter sp.]
MGRSLAVMAVANLIAARGALNDIIVPEPETHPTTLISLYEFSFFFPVNPSFEGNTATCPYGASECPVADDSTHLLWGSNDIRFYYVSDRFGADLGKIS